MKNLLPHRARLDTKRHKWLALCLVEAAEGITNFCLLGFFTVRWRGLLLFSDWMDG